MVQLTQKEMEKLHSRLTIGAENAVREYILGRSFPSPNIQERLMVALHNMPGDLTRADVERAISEILPE